MASNDESVANLERQCDEVGAIQAIFPDQADIDEDTLLALQAAVDENNADSFPGKMTFAVTLSVPAATEDAPNANVTATFSFPKGYPEKCACSVMVCSESFSRKGEDEFNRQVALFLEDSIGSECALVALNFIEEHASDAFITKPTISTAPVYATATAQIRVRSWVRFNHLLSGKAHAKERSMVVAAKDFGITGYIVYGTPGLVCAEGDVDDVKSFLAECRKIGKKPDVATEGEIAPETQTSSSGGKARLEELSMGQLEALLVEQGLGDQRREILGVV